MGEGGNSRRAAPPFPRAVRPPPSPLALWAIRRWRSPCLPTPAVFSPSWVGCVARRLRCAGCRSVPSLRRVSVAARGVVAAFARASPLCSRLLPLLVCFRAFWAFVPVLRGCFASPVNPAFPACYFSFFLAFFVRFSLVVSIAFCYNTLSVGVGFFCWGVCRGSFLFPCWSCAVGVRLPSAVVAAVWRFVAVPVFRLCRRLVWRVFWRRLAWGRRRRRWRFAGRCLARCVGRVRPVCWPPPFRRARRGPSCWVPRRLFSVWCRRRSGVGLRRRPLPPPWRSAVCRLSAVALRCSAFVVRLAAGSARRAGFARSAGCTLVFVSIQDCER